MIKMAYLYSLFLWTLTGFSFSQTKNEFFGAWKSEDGIIVFSGNYFSYSQFDDTGKVFNGTYGGLWSCSENTVTFFYEFNSMNPEKTGKTNTLTIKREPGSIWLDGKKFVNLDQGGPGILKGAWLFGGRFNNGVLASRDTSEARKTMKILSGTRFQWIAYHSGTGEFFGTGGGTYTAIDGKYIENIDFFSRDSTRIGALLEFDYELMDNEWHHRGFSSRGEPLYEIWILRK